MENKKSTGEEVIEVLMKFLKNATGDNATKNEIDIIPEVAKLILDYSVPATSLDS